ncbi:AfsR/SARP family transcriptional regulator [Arthrobacter mobilis]|uniref:SARP family transcriptional regulator n=1 Tax=Arthrobacter mobilis TaxID=2724944 RepID=A0A7X6HE83_9MICC|nr:BTAD domain-containing putative transcriptional regulator [Arthrobacter mobilis]NKX55519.1 SARP family transcriptional regulator [Arthrobacter mobilis]
MGANLWELQLIGGWRLRCDGRYLKVGLRQQRLIAALALLGSQPRPFLAGLLWPDSTDAQASGSLREAIWAISRQLPGLMTNDDGRLELADTVHLDLSDIWDTAAGPSERNRMDLLARGELLPGWYDDWVLYEQEQFRFRRLAALETMAEDRLACGDASGALEAVRAALRIDPLHGNAMRLLLRVHLSEGNHAGALSAYRDFSSRMQAEFGASLPADISGLIRPLLVHS